MAQGVLPFKYEAGKSRSGMTALAGLPTYLDLASVCGLQASIDRHVGVRRGTQGWSDAQMLMSLILLNLAGGECVDDLSILQGDPGFAELMYRVEAHGMARRERRALVRRFRKERTTATPSPSSVFRYLSAFHDPHGAADRQPHKAFIPAAGEHLRGLARVNADVVAFVQKHSPHKHATLVRVIPECALLRVVQSRGGPGGADLWRAGLLAGARFSFHSASSGRGGAFKNLAARALVYPSALDARRGAPPLL